MRVGDVFVCEGEVCNQYFIVIENGEKPLMMGINGRGRLFSPSHHYYTHRKANECDLNKFYNALYKYGYTLSDEFKIIPKE